LTTKSPLGARLFCRVGGQARIASTSKKALAYSDLPK